MSETLLMQRFYHWGEDKDEDFPEGDLEKILAADYFDFAMVGTRGEEGGITYVEVEKKTMKQNVLP